MYLVSEEFSNQIKADNREFSVALTFNSSAELTGTTIQNITVDEVVNSSDVLTFGCACSNKVTVKLINAPTTIDYRNSFFTARQGLKIGEMPTRYEDVPLGKFYVTDVQTTNDFKNVTITGYDGFCKMTGTYISDIAGETTLQAVYDDLKLKLFNEYRIVLKDAVLPDYKFSFSNIENITYQQAIAYIAGCLGGFARFDRYGELEIAKYTETHITVTREDQYMNGFKKLTDKPLQITSIATGTKDNPIVIGEGKSGVSVNFENPYITEKMASAIYDDYADFNYTPCQLRWRGNPAIQAGDIIHVVDGDGASHNVLVMSQKIKIGSGLNTVVDCKGKTENISKFSKTFETSSQKIDRMYKDLEQAIINATQKIVGSNSGYVIFEDTNGDGSPDEILIMDKDTKEAAQNVWCWNNEGLGFSSTGYSGPYKTAITADGKIVADFITAGGISAERITLNKNDKESQLSKYIRLDGDSIVLGEESENAISLKLENDKIAFYSGDDVIAYFSNNSFEIENLIDGKIRFQNFGFIPRQNGNLTFTKLT